MNTKQLAEEIIWLTLRVAVKDVPTVAKKLEILLDDAFLGETEK